MVNRRKAVDPVIRLFIILSGLFLGNNQGKLIKHSVNLITNIAVRIVGLVFEIVDDENLNVIPGYVKSQVLLCLHLDELGRNNYPDLLALLQ